MPVRAVAVVAGVAFGFLISWAGLTDPDRIRDMLLFEDWYLYPMFVSAVAVGFVGLRALRGSSFRAIVTRDLVTWTTAPPRQRHLVGSVLFGTGRSVPPPRGGKGGEGHSAAHTRAYALLRCLSPC